MGDQNVGFAIILSFEDDCLLVKETEIQEYDSASCAYHVVIKDQEKRLAFSELADIHSLGLYMVNGTYFVVLHHKIQGLK